MSSTTFASSAAWPRAVDASVTRPDARAQRRAPREQRRARLALGAGDDEEVTGAALVRGRGAARELAPDGRGLEPATHGARAARLERHAEVDDLDRSDGRGRVEHEPELARAHGRRQVGAEGHAAHASRVGVEPRRDVDGDLVGGRGVHGGERGRRNARDVVAQADAEDRVDDDARAGEARAPGRLVGPRRRRPRSGRRPCARAPRA